MRGCREILTTSPFESRNDMPQKWEYLPIFSRYKWDLNYIETKALEILLKPPGSELWLGDSEFQRRTCTSTRLPSTWLRPASGFAPRSSR